MVDKGIGDYFITDTDEADLDQDLLQAPVVVPVVTPAADVPAAPAGPTSEPVAPTVQAPVVPQQVAPAPTSAARPQAVTRRPSREERLAQALDALIQEDPDIEAAALVSLDGFTMASALPAGMQADRVGAMSAAILGLGERAAAELGRGHLAQVFIEGETGFVLLVAAGDRAVLTVIASKEAKLGLVLYDMKQTAARVAEILG